jgi:hypothetical protein
MKKAVKENETRRKNKGNRMRLFNKKPEADDKKFIEATFLKVGFNEIFEE